MTISFRILLFISVFFIFGLYSYSQQVYTKELMKADKLFIKKDYETAALLYTSYLQQHQRDYYASRQSAICYDYLGDHYSAIDHWPIVVENSETNESDYLSFAKCLLMNDRLPEAKKMFSILAKSANPYYASWGKAYLNPYQFYMDSSLYVVSEVKDLNTSFSESSPFLYSGKLIYHVDRTKNPRAYTPAGDQSGQYLTAVNQMDSMFFTPSELLLNLRSIPVYGQFCFTPDGQYLYFSKAVSNEDLKIKSPYTYSRYQIYILNISTLNSKQPEIKSFAYNSLLYDFIHPAISADGQKLYFASDMKGSMGGKDLYVCENENGTWGPPKNLGPNINSAGHELYPMVQEDGSFYFASDGRPGLGGLDLFTAKPEENSFGFTKAKNMGYPLNTRYDDFGMYFIKEKRKGYLSSNRKGNNDYDLYYFYKTE